MVNFSNNAVFNLSPISEDKIQGMVKNLFIDRKSVV